MSDPKFYGFLGLQMAAALGLAGFVILWRGPWNAARYAGVSLAMTGMVLLSVARLQLGKSFSVTAQARKLVTHGIYCKIRNPIYVFSGMLVLGVLLVVQRPYLFLLFALLIVMQTWRAHREARVLEDKFGDEYREYRRNTWF
jgi:protein-S-isoprenylcysteine O-methyltransferase Ste14